MSWTTKQIRYLDEHAHEGADEIAEALGKTVKAVQWMASKRGVSLRKRYTCPKCGSVRTVPLNAVTGWCRICTKEEHVRQLGQEAELERKEVRREQELDREANRYYNRKYRAKKKRKSPKKS